MEGLSFSLKQFFIVAIAINLKGNFVFTGVKPDDKLNLLLNILKPLGLQFEFVSDELKINSFKAHCLFEPTSVIEVEEEEAIVYAISGLLAGLDYKIFFESSKIKSGFTPLILGLYDAGVRFDYSPNFTLPFSMKGTSNLVPLNYTLVNANPLLHLLFVLIGIGGIGRTKISSPYPALKVLFRILEELKADVKKISEEEITVASLKEDVTLEVKVNLQFLNTI